MCVRFCLKFLIQNTEQHQLTNGYCEKKFFSKCVIDFCLTIINSNFERVPQLIKGGVDFNSRS